MLIRADSASTLEFLRTDKLTWLSRALSLTGLLISTYLAVTYLKNSSPVCPAHAGGCEVVAHSRYARPGGIPLPLFGMAGYLLLFVTACMPGQRARTWGMMLTVGAIGISLTLTYFELNVIHAVCWWCVSSATCAFFHVVVNSARYVRGDPQLAPRPLPIEG